MSRPATTPDCRAARPSLGVLLAACAVALAATEARARPHFPTTLVIEPFHLRARPSVNPGYLPLVGTVPLRWNAPPPPAAAPAIAPLVLYNPPAPASKHSATNLPQTGPATGATAEPEKAPPLKAKDFLPFFQRDETAPPATSGPGEGLQFTPARPTLPTSSADFRQQ